MKRLFIFTYPKLTVYVIALVGAYLAFQTHYIQSYLISFNGFIYLTVFVAGLLYSAGFSTPIATGFFIAMDFENPLIFALIGSLGALVSDLGIFSFMRLSFMNEFNRLKKTSFINHLTMGFNSLVPLKIRSFIIYVFVAIVIASPLPDELAVAMLAGFTKVHPYAFMSMSLIGNAIGIYLLLLI